LNFRAEAFTIPAMPYNWVKIHSSPPRQRRDEVRTKAGQKGGRLCEGQIFYDAAGQAYALVQVPDDAAQRQDLLATLGASSALGLVDADEQADGKQPPPSS
jgi:hypothetical protein